MRKQLMFIMIVGIVGVAIWVSSTIYFTATSKEVSGDVTQYTGQMSNTFNIQKVDDVFTRVEDNLPIHPDVFKDYEITSP